MLLKATTGAVDSEGLSDTKQFTIKADAVMAHILSQQIYQDPIGAIIREYSNNGWDGQKALGNEDVPMLVKVPTSFDPTFIVRDYGVGMSNEDLIERMSTYGASSKRADKAMIGGLGIGSKAGFARAESFVITSWFDGMKTSFVCSKGATGMFEINRLSDPEPSTEHTGVEVSIPVAISDISTYQHRMRAFYARWTVLPTFTGYKDFKVERIDYLVEARGWKLRRVPTNSYSAQPAFAMMGQTAYQIDVSKIPNITSAEREILELPIDFQFAVSDLTVAVSRESLSYDVKTVQVLKMKAAQVRADIPGHFNSVFKDAQSLWEAKIVYAELVDKTPLAKLLSLGAVWNGVLLKNRFIEVTLPDFRVIRSCDARQSKLVNIRFTSESYVKLDPAAKPRIFKVDTKVGLQRVFKHEMRSYPSGLIIVLIPDDEHFDDTVELLGNPPWEKLSDIYIPPAPVYVRDPTERTIKKLFAYNGSTFSETEVDVTDGGVYVGLENGDTMARTQSPHQLYHRARSIGMKFELIGIPRTNKAVENKPGWVHVEDHVRKLLAERPLPGQAMVNLAHVRQVFNDDDGLRPFRLLAPIIKGRLFEKLNASLEQLLVADEVTVNTHRVLLESFGMKFTLPKKPTVDIAKQLAAMAKKYPLIVQFSEQNSEYDSKKPATLALFQAYVDAV